MLRTAITICLFAALAAVIMGVVCQVTKSGPPMAVWVACFLIAFGLNKALVAVEKLDELKAVAAGGPDPRATFANPFIFWAYIATKFAVFAVAWSVAAYLLTRPEALSFPR
jgi:hypothetical protein